MRGREGKSPSQVQSFFQELYFTENPCIDSTFPSFVYQGKNRDIVGFLGGVVRKMSACGQSIRVALGGNFVVHPGGRGELPAMRLLGALMEGNQDLSLTDSANNISRLLLERVGWSTIVPFSIHWVRVLRPAQYAVFNLSRVTAPSTSAALTFAATPFCEVLDRVTANVRFNPFRLAEPLMHGEELTVETLLHCIGEFRNGYSIWAQYDIHGLEWLLSFMQRMPGRGDLRKVVVRNDDRKILGWYVYYAKSGAVGEVVQIGGAPRYTRHILDHLFRDAWNHGVIALHGVANTQLLPDFSAKNCLFTCRGGWALAHSKHPELLELLNRGDAFLSRLDTEWCLDPGGRLAE
jgi:hypothetical protein